MMSIADKGQICFLLSSIQCCIPMYSRMFQHKGCWKSIIIKLLIVQKICFGFVTSEDESIEDLLILCPFAVYYLRYADTSQFTISRIPLADGKRAGQKVHRKSAIAVQNVKPLYFLSRSFEIRETNCQQLYLRLICITGCPLIGGYIYI